MFWEIFISGFVLGAISSFHCVGMCGPLALSLPLGQFSNAGKATGVILYNLGRCVTYGFIGLLFGFLGRQVSLAGFQQWFSVIAGVVILSVFLLTFFHKRVNGFKSANQFYRLVQSLVARFLRIRNISGYFLTGMANGLLPCGMVYLAVTGAMVTSSPWSGMGFMLAFGTGTMPAMMLLSLAGFFISFRARAVVKRLTPYAFLFMGILLILRGLELGIPYVSPLISSTSAVEACH